MEQLYRTLQLSARVYHRILKTARTIADLEDREEMGNICWRRHVIDLRRRIGINCAGTGYIKCPARKRGRYENHGKRAGCVKTGERDRYVYGGGREKICIFLCSTYTIGACGQNGCLHASGPGGI